MNSNYVINRLKTTLYKYSTVDVLRKRLDNIDERSRHEILTNLKKEIRKESNMDIQRPLFELLYRMPLVSQSPLAGCEIATYF